VAFVGPDGASEWAIGKNALQWFSAFLEPEPRPDVLIMEAVLPIEALQGETNRIARDRLVALQAVLGAVAFCRGVINIKTVPTLAVRKHFCGSRFAKKDDVVSTCRRLGWPIADHNAADACACWDYACALADPMIGIARSPLFAR
jgi:hypothetical protein